MSRKLASIQIVKDLKPIEGRDRIVLASVLGWEVIVKKDEFKVGNKCIYVEIDSVLPQKPEFEFMRNKNFRVKTMKMAGVYSQGLVLPMSLLPNKEWNEGDDVTDLLGIVKYDEYAGEEPIGVSNLSKKKYNWFQKIWYKIFGYPKRKKGGFSTLISKTDETRIQNIPEVLSNKEPVCVSQKVDGSSCSMTMERTLFGHKFNVYSRNLNVGRDNSNYWKAADMYDMENRMELMMNDMGVKWVAVQGEIAGPGIQKNPEGLKDIDFFVFNIINPNGRLGNKEMVEVCSKYGFTTVPMISYDYILPDTVDEMLKYATGPSLINPNVNREGVVVRSQDGKHSFKAVSPEYLVKHGK